MNIRYTILTAFLALTLHAGAQQSDSTDKAIRLSELSLDELMNIKVVTASGFLQTTSEAPSTIRVITAKQIAERGYEELEDVLRDIPGIDMIHIGGYAPTLYYFRGMYGAENLRALMMIDGIVENNILGSNDMAGPAYSLHNVERIEVIWGPVSSLYGANAFGGAINIITKKGADIQGLYVEKGFGTFNTSVERASFGFQRSKFELALAGSLYSTDGPVFANRDPKYHGSYVDNAYSFNGTLSYFTEKSKLSLGVRAYDTPMGWGTYSNSPTSYLGLPSQGNGNTGVIGVLSRDVRDEKSGLDDSYLRTVFLQNEYKPNEKFELLARAIYRETGIGDDSYIYVTVDGKNLIRGRVAASSNRAAGELSANYSPSEKHKLSGGIQFYQDNVEQGSRRATFDPKAYLIDGKDTVINLNSVFLPRLYDIRNNFGSYLQYVINTNLLGKTNFTLGGRYDYNSYFGDAISPRAVIVNKPNDQLTFKFQFGKAFRAPSNLEIHQAALTFQLTTEKIKTYEVNAIYSPTKTVTFQVNGFRNELRDVIVLSNLGGLTPNKNPATHDVNGIESSLNLVFSTYVEGFANFTYQHAVGENLVTHATGNIPAIAKFKGNAGVTIHAEDAFTISLSGNWVGKRRAQVTNPFGPVPGYLLTNFVLSTKPLFNNMVTASINIQNIFNKTWLDPGFRTADGSLYSTVQEQPGRTGLFKIAVSFK